MSWPNPFLRKDKDSRYAWGYNFQWTPQHMTPEEMHPLKYSYDVLSEKCLERLDTISPPNPAEQLPRNRSRPIASTKPPVKRDLYALLRDHASEDETLGQLWDEVNTIPDWVDWDQIARGQDVFYRYGGVALTALAYQSLLGGMGAARVTEVLARTGGFSTKVAKARMYETTQHILQVTSDLQSIKPGGPGHVSTIRVRLLHAAVRRRIMKLAKEKPDYYSVEQFGIPINDLDSILPIIFSRDNTDPGPGGLGDNKYFLRNSNLARFPSTRLVYFSEHEHSPDIPFEHNCLSNEAVHKVKVFPCRVGLTPSLIGIWMRQQEILDYIALWRLVAHYIGTPTQYFETPERAKAMMESLLISEIRPSETSKVLANNIILSLQGQPPAYASRDFLVASARWLNGDELADCLGLGRPSLYYKALVAGQCIFFVFICYTYRSIPYLDKRKLKAFRRILYQVIVENKTHGLGEETTFDFKHIPNLDTTTSMGEYVSGLQDSGVERRNLKALVMGSAFMGLISFLLVKTSLGVVRQLRGWFS